MLQSSRVSIIIKHQHFSPRGWSARGSDCNTRITRRCLIHKDERVIVLVCTREPMSDIKQHGSVAAVTQATMENTIVTPNSMIRQLGTLFHVHPTTTTRDNSTLCLYVYYKLWSVNMPDFQ